MHELSITQSVVDAIVEKSAGRKVTAVRLRVGRLSGFVPDAMRFCFELASEGTNVHGAALDIDEPPGVAHCRTCEEDFLLTDLVLLCPCGSADVEVVSGRELVVASVDVV